MRSATKSSGCRSGRSSAIASSPSSATVEIATVFELIGAAWPPMLVDHHHAALHGRHRASLDLGLDLRLDRNHHTLDGHPHLIDLDAALAHLEFDGLHRLRLDFTEIHFVCLVSHLQCGALVALLEFDGLITLLDGDGQTIELQQGNQSTTLKMGNQ